MSSSSFGHTFIVEATYGDGSDSKPTRVIDMHQSIKKPLYYVRFNTSLSDDAVKLGYAAVDEIQADENIAIIDRSMIALENSAELVTGEVSFYNDVYSSYYKNILITDVYTEDIPSQPIVPLFYRHLLSGTVDTSTICVLDTSFNRINQNAYRIVTHPEYDEDGTLTGDTESIGIYNNFQNSFDEDSGELIAYYVQYIDSAGVTQTLLLNNEYVYREATFDDINWTTLKLKEWVKAYIINMVGNYYEFTLPTVTNYSIRHEQSIRLYVEKPVVDSHDLPWFLRVTNGAFTHTIDNKTFNYHVPEFRDQQFNPVEPYKFVLAETVDKIASGMVQLKHTPTALADLPADIVIQDRDGTILYALTTNTTKAGTVYYLEGVATSITWDADKILSFDANSGIVQLDVTLKDYYTITATYYYTENYYEFSLVDLNPLINSDALEHYYVIYLVPETSYNSGLESAIHYLQVGRDGIVKSCSQSDISSYIVGLPYGRPINQSIAGGGAGILGHEFMVYNDGVDGRFDFLRQYTLEAPTGFPGAEYPNRYLILAEVSVVQQSSINDVTILDDRQRGGGIKDAYDQEAKLINPEVAWYGDIGLGGGISYPAKSAVVVRLPHCLLTEYGGVFTEDNLFEIVKRHMPFGHYPILDFYGIIPDISIEDVSNEGELTISWPSEGSECTYNLYYSTSGIRYTKDNSTPIADNASGNSYTLTSLVPNLTYYIYVKAIHPNHCGIPVLAANVCGSASIPNVYDSSVGEWDSHEGPQSIILQVKPLIIVPRDEANSLGHQFTVII